MNRSFRTFILLSAAMAALFTSNAMADQFPFIIGLVEVPAIFGKSGEGNGKGNVTLRKAPSPGSPVAQVIRFRHQLHYREHGYGVLSAVVHEWKNGWCRIGYSAEGQEG